jgi:hypothetical protein
MPRTPVKQKRSYTLSEESVRFLDRMKRTRRARSVSAVLDEVLRDVAKASHARALDQAVDTYYSSIPAESRAEDELWGQFALQQFPAEER